MYSFLLHTKVDMLYSRSPAALFRSANLEIHSQEVLSLNAHYHRLASPRVAWIAYDFTCNTQSVHSHGKRPRASKDIQRVKD